MDALRQCTAAIEWLGIDSFMDPIEIDPINGRAPPGHKPGKASKETIELLREACASSGGMRSLPAALPLNF